MSAQTYKDIRITWVFYQIEQVYLVTWTRHIRFAEFALRWVSGIISCDLKLYAICRVPRNARSRIMGILHSHRSDSWLRFRFRSVLGGAFFRLLDQGKAESEICRESERAIVSKELCKYMRAFLTFLMNIKHNYKNWSPVGKAVFTFKIPALCKIILTLYRENCTWWKWGGLWFWSFKVFLSD